MGSTKGPRRKGGGRCLGKVRCGRPRDGGRGSGWPYAGKGHLSQPPLGTAGADSVTPGRTRGQARLLGSGGGAGPSGAGRGMRRPEGTGGGLPGLSGALVMRPPASTDAGAGARAARGRALSPTASVMKATWMKSDSQLSTYMNHMAPPPRPPASPPGRACALGLRQHGVAATAAASPPRGRSCAAAESSPAGAPPPAGSGLAPPAGAEGQPLLPRPARARGPPGSRGCKEGAGRQCNHGEAGRS